MKKTISLRGEIYFHGILIAALVVLILSAAGLWRSSAHRILESKIDEQALSGKTDLGAIDQWRERTVWVSFAASGGAAVVVLIGIGVVARRLERRLGGPIERLGDQIERTRLEPGEHEKIPRAEGPAEIRRLAEAFGQMTARLKLQYASLAKLADMRRRIVEMLSHDFGNAMTGLIGGLELLGSGVELSDAERARFLKMARENARTLQRMSEDFIAIVQSQSASASYALVPVEFQQLAARSIEALHYRSAIREISVSFEADRDLSPVLANAPIMGFALNNLIGNAIKYSRPGGTVFVRLRQGPRLTRIEIEDQGIGMDANALQAALAGGYRSPEAQRIATGFGIGLSLVKEAVEGHGTRLEARSRPGKGTVMAFSLENAPAARETRS